MKRNKTAAFALIALLAAGVAGTAALSHSNPADARAPGVHGYHGSDRIDGQVAYLKAELKITPAQAAQWAAVEKAMRDAAAGRKAMREQAKADRDKPKTSVERLKAREKFAAARAEQAKTFVAAYEPLYNAMNDEQRKAADELFAPRRHRRH